MGIVRRQSAAMDDDVLPMNHGRDVRATLAQLPFLG